MKKIVILLIYSLLICLTAKTQTINIDSSVTALINMQEDTNKVNAINDFIWAVKQMAPDTAIYMGDISIALATKLNFYNGLGYAGKNIGGTYYYKGLLDSAMKYYEISLDNFEIANNKQGVAIAFRNMGNIYDQKGDWKRALDLYLKSKLIREEIGDKKGLAALNNSIGLLYKNSKQEEDSAIRFHEKALAIYQELDIKIGIAESYLFIANFYFDKEEEYYEKQENNLTEEEDKNKITPDSIKYQKTLEYILKARKICEEITEERYLSICEEIIGKIYTNRQQYDSAYKYLVNSIKLSIKLGNKAGTSSAYSSMGFYYLSKDEYRNAEANYFKALRLATSVSPLIKSECYKNLASVYEGLKDYEKAYDFHKKYQHLKDSLEDEDNVKEMTKLSMQYEFDKVQKLNEIEQQQKDEIQKAQLKRQRMLTIFFISGFIFMIILAIVIFSNYRNKQKANKMLEEKNLEILAKNDILQQKKLEIEIHRDEISKNRDTLVEKNDKIEKQNKHITDSIVYAKRIQSAVLPPKEYMDSILNDYFILFRPRDIVSGDFYWATKKNDKLIVTAVDCTGHGVPGAFMSMLGVSFLNEIINKMDNNEEKITAGAILDNLKAGIMKSLRQTGKDNEAKDGMDMSLCVVDYQNMILHFAGAHNALYLTRQNQLLQYKADRMPVGIGYRHDEPFTNNEIEIFNNDICYLFSDGYTDQFGGKDGRKYSAKNFKDLITNICLQPLDKQKEIMEQEFENWMNYLDKKGEKYEQLDDVLVMAFKISR